MVSGVTHVVRVDPPAACIADQEMDRLFEALFVSDGTELHC